MKRLNNKLKLSVSMIALMCGGGLATSPALALTYTGDETGVVIGSNLAEDLIVSSTGSITPDGLLVNASVTGDLTNAGLIEQIDSGTATSSSDLDIEVIAIDFNGSLGGDFVNSGIIKADASASVDYAVTGNGVYSNDVTASASGMDINSVTGDVTNSGTISAVASSELVSSFGTATTPVTSISISDCLLYTSDAADE